MAYRFTDDEDQRELLKILRKFIEKEIILIRAEMMKQENSPVQILQ